MDEADKTIFDSTDLDSEERAAVKSGEERGKLIAMREDPERFGLAGERGRNIKKYEGQMTRIFGERPLNVWPRDENGELIDD